MITDDKYRREFSTGAVRDTNEGKGMPHLMPLDIVARWTEDDVYADFNSLIRSLKLCHWELATDLLNEIQSVFRMNHVEEEASFIIGLSIHFELGKIKYEEDNWKKGIPWESYVDSMIRHYVKAKDGWEDEDHVSAFLWNCMALEWSIRHIYTKPDVENDIDPAWKFDEKAVTEC